MAWHQFVPGNFCLVLFLSCALTYEGYTVPSYAEETCLPSDTLRHSTQTVLHGRISTCIPVNCGVECDKRPPLLLYRRRKEMQDKGPGVEKGEECTNRMTRPTKKTKSSSRQSQLKKYNRGSVIGLECPCKLDHVPANQK
ncbi:hypothetical protein CHS0354_041407 [Potamilus streckersoni]|uniref:Secreted protein n=1 Tax=Potamilus streckersoni TaxID=2493646 RepID=A0AAE0TA60_9BIVA|nr:hypothetical protein CHS0354_041407 [Potamilus streckersoni]